MNKKIDFNGELKIGRLTIIKMDWFEWAKFTSFFSGVCFAASVAGFGKLMTDGYATLPLLLGVVGLLNFFIFQEMTKTIRSLNLESKLEIKIKK